MRKALTVPNLLSISRICLIPVFFGLIVAKGSGEAGLLLFGVVAATDWIDGWIARRTGTVTELGKLLDPLADRLVLGALLIAVMVRGAFPVWIGILLIIRDLGILAIGAFLLERKQVRVDVRFVGKAATFALMVAVPSIAWADLRLPAASTFAGFGWPLLIVGMAEYAVATAAYAVDLRAAVAA
jgi:cardiolipin synthase